MDTSKFSSEIHIFKRVAIVVMIFFIMTLLHYSTLINESDPAVFSITLLGFMLILSFNLGKILSRLKLPKLTIYIVTGILCGPFVMGFVSAEVVKNLKFVDNLALSMIAFIAGGEMRLKELLKIRKTLLSISFFETLFVFVLISLAFFVLSPFIGLTADRDWVFIAIISMLIGSLLIANSPAVTIGIIGEYRSEGPLTDTILGTVVLKDIVVIVVFSIVTSFAAVKLIPGVSFELIPFLGKLGYEIFGSIAMGLGIGFLVWLYVRFVGEQTVLFIVGVAFMVYEVGRYYHLEVLLIGVTAGFCVQNFTKQGEKLINHIEESLPVIYPIFFSIAGAKLNLLALKELWYITIILVVTRWWAIYRGSRLGASMAGAPPEIGRYAWMGLISQAGVALGLAVLLERMFPEWGGALQTLLIPVIGMNELAGPIFLKYALDKVNEIPVKAEETDTLINLSIGDQVDNKEPTIGNS